MCPAPMSITAPKSGSLPDLKSEPTADGPDAGPHHFVFVLIPEFTLLSMAGALECLRIANRMSGVTKFTWTLVSVDGEAVMSSAGTVFGVDGALPETNNGDMILLCGGLNVQTHTDKALFNWLRRESRRRVTLTGLCTATHILAKAGLLQDRKATIHWENQESFEEDFPDIDLTRSVFTIDGNRITTAGGTASIDMMLRILAQLGGEDLAGTVADQMIYSSIRSDHDSQRLSVPSRIGVRHEKLAQVINCMESNIEDPISPSTLARDVGLSTRQLERLFRRYLNRSPKRFYMDLRLQKARNLLLQTDMTVINIALACGFTSPSHFSKCYRAQYETTPYRERGATATRQAADPDFPKP